MEGVLGGFIDPAHNFIQSPIFTIKIIAGVLSLPLIWVLTQNSLEDLLNDFTDYLFSPPLGHIINVIICKKGFVKNPVV